MFEGSMVALVTPMNQGQIDEQALRNLIDRQIENGTSCIVPCGTTGESATLTHEEHDRVIKVTVEQVAGRVPVIAGAGSNATHEAIKLTKSAKEFGADAALLISPYYNKPNQEGLFEHYKAVATEGGLPIFLYNVPSRTCVNLLPETVAKLSKIDGVIGIKEACGDLDQIQQVIDQCPKDFIVLSGEDAQTLDMYTMGARGAISVTANILPKECAQEWTLFKQGKFDEASAIHEKLMALHTTLFLETNPIPVKEALTKMGLIHGELRLPLTRMSPQASQRLEIVLKEYSLC